MKIIIIGGVAGGATAAARLRRLNEDNQIIIFEKGEHVSFANCGLPYHIGGAIKDRNSLLLQTPESLKNRFNIDVRILSEVISIDNKNKTIIVKDLNSNKSYTESYDKLLLSPGAEPFKPNIPGINSDKVLTLRNVSDMDKIIQKIQNKKNIAVIGGGFIGLEVAENLIEKKYNVTIIEMANQVMAPVDLEFASFAHHKAKENNIKLLLNTAVNRFEDFENQIEVHFNTNNSLNFDLVIFAIGVKPENKLAKDISLEIGNSGGILVNDFLQTSDENIYAVGDAIEVKHFIDKRKVLIPLAWPANRQGRLVADNITFGNKYKYNGSLGSAILKFFDITIASTGINEKTLKNLNINYKTVTVTRSNHASYYPNSSAITLKLLFSETGNIFGAQAVGKQGIDKRIDIIATAIKGNLTIFDLADLEVTYAPPYNSAKDPVNILGYVAENILNKEFEMINFNEVEQISNNSENILIDVRTPKEFSQGNIPNSINMELDYLRNNLEKLDKNKTYILYCQVGLRGYIACKLLNNNGFNTKNLNGGYSIWEKVYKENF